MTALILCAGVAVVHASWSTPTFKPNVGIPFGAGPFLASISFGDATHGWAVGSENSALGGLVMATTDGGSTWSPQTIPAGSQQLTAVAAVSATTAWTVGTSVSGPAEILATTNGGATWTQQTASTPTTTSLDGVSFVSSTTGWVVGQVNNGTVAPVILGTTNGGALWTAETVPAGVTSVTSVWFVDASHGWATDQTSTGDGVISTTDGGTTWTAESVPASIALRGITFRDALHGWAVGGSGGSALILVTSNGGATWTAQTAPAGMTTITGVAFANLSVGWIVASPGLFGQPGPGVATTVNGGATWTAQNTPVSSNSFNGVAALSTTTAFAAGYGPCQQPALDATTNGGTTWTERLAQAPSVMSLAAVASLDTSHAWAVGSDTCGYGAALRTTDGTHWSGIELPQGVGDLLDVTFTDASHGWAVGFNTGFGPSEAGLVIASNDGGVTWQIQNIPSGIGALRGVHFVDSTHGWAVGASNTGPSTAVIIVTSDGGATWTMQTPPAGCNDMGDVWFVDATHGWATGCPNSPQVMVTTNGGGTWTSQTVPAGSSPGGIDFADLNNGWTAGQGSGFTGEVLNTSNGGGTWAAQTAPPSGPLTDVSMFSASVGWVTGSGIDATTNGGATWTAQAAPARVSLNGVVAVSTSIAWAVGTEQESGPYLTSGPAILKTTDGGTTWNAQPWSYPAVNVQSALPALANNAYGGYTTVTYVQNVGNEPAATDVFYRDSSGASVGAGDTAVLEPGQMWAARQDNGHSLASGQPGSGFVFSSQPVAVFVNEFAPAAGDATSYTGLGVTGGFFGTTLFAPAIANGAYGGYTTGIGLINAGSAPTNVTVTYRDANGAVVTTQPIGTVPAGAYQGIYSGGAGLPAAFAGTATITSSGQPLAAVVNETGPGGQLSSYDALAQGNTTLFAPAALNNAYGGYFTGMGIQNATGAPGTVTINYYNATGTATTKTFPIKANGYLGVYQGSPTDGPAPGAYTAKITSTVAIAAIVNEVAPSTTPAKQSTAYNTFAAGGSPLFLPLVESAGSDGWSTGEGIMNTGTSATTVTVTYFDTNTSAQVGTAQTMTLQPNAFWGLYQPSGGLPNGSRATAVVTTSAGGQVAVICNESNATSFMSYSGQ